MKDIPKKIYLQVGDIECFEGSFKELNGVSWCDERIESTDIEYILNGKKNAPTKEGEIKP